MTWRLRLGWILFHRTKRTIRLTEAGQVFLTEARKTLYQAKHAILLAQQTGRGEIGKFVVGFTGPALNTVLPKIVRRFKEKHPNIELGLERLQTNEQVEALRSQQIQAGLLHPPIDDDFLKLEIIHRERLVAVLSDSHRLAQPEIISISELAHESFIFYPRHVGSVLYDRILGLCQQAGFSPRIALQHLPLD